MVDISASKSFSLLFSPLPICYLLALIYYTIFLKLVNSQLVFVSMGNWGAANKNQKMTAKTLKSIAKEDHASFIISPGSNFLGGITSLNDSMWGDAFEKMYSDEEQTLKVPFFTVLGSEDWGSNYTAQVFRTHEMYSNEHNKDIFPKWSTPNWWYHYTAHFTAATGPSIFTTGHQDFTVCFTFIDTWILSTNFPVHTITDMAWSDIKKTLQTQQKICDYIFVVGDEPIYSSGGAKKNSYLARHLMPLLKEADVDSYISGNDLTMEAFQVEGISFINCGSASKGSSSIFSSKSEDQFFSGEIGFCVHKITPNGVNSKFIQSSSGSVLYNYFQPIKTRTTLEKLSAINIAKELPEVHYVEVPSMVRMPGREVFIKVVGSIGLCIAFFFLSLSFMIGASRVTK